MDFDIIHQRAKEYVDSKFDHEGAVADVVRGFLVAAVFIVIAVIVLYNIAISVPRIPNTSIYCTTFDNVNTLTNSGIGLLAVSLIVIAAVGVLYYLGFLGGGGKK